MHQDIPKQFLTVDERPVIVYTLEAVERHPEIDAMGTRPAGIRQTVQLELEKHFAPDDMVLIHDAIRSMVSPEVVSYAIRVATIYSNATPVFGYSIAAGITNSETSSRLCSRLRGHHG